VTGIKLVRKLGFCKSLLLPAANPADVVCVQMVSRFLTPTSGR